MPLLILEVLAANAAFAAVALGLGELLLRAAERAGGAAHPEVGRPQPSLRRLGAALLAGLGGCALGGIALGGAGLFRWQAFAVAGAAVVVVSLRHLAAYARGGVRLLGQARSAGPPIQVAVALALVLGGARWLAALAPPEATDELAYHLPEAHALADTHSLHLTLGTDAIYGNLPTLMETLYGEALAVRGPALVHVLHLTAAVGLALLAAGVVRELWGGRAAAVAILGLALYGPLLQNATTGYVDAAATAFEAGAVLLLARWVARREPGLVTAAALLLGFGLGVKYTTLATVAMAAALLGVVLLRERRWRLAAAAPAVALLACGYWYGKNLVRFGNPVFPFAFGHPGVSDATYRYFVDSVHQFHGRTLGAFAHVPLRFAGNDEVTAFLGLVLSPLAFLARGPRRAVAVLFAYAAAYTTYWFWLGSSQTRFVMSAVVVAIVLGAVALGAARGPAAVLAAVVLAAAAGGVVQWRTHSFSPHVRPTLRAWLAAPKSRYALGLESLDAYLHRNFGCQVDAVAELERRHLRGAVGLWELAPAPEYPRHNRLAPLHVTATTPAGAAAELRADGFRYVLGPGPSAAGLSSNPAAQPVLEAARPFWRHGGCVLFRLDFAAVAPADQ